MRLFWYECRKIVTVPMLWIFLFLCLLLNTIGIINDNYGVEYVNYVSQTTKKYGQMMREEWDKSLVALDENVLSNQLMIDTKESIDPYEDFNAIDLAERYISIMKLSKNLSRKMTEKYIRFQGSIEQLAKKDAGINIYAASETYDQHDRLFNKALHLILTEGILIGVLLAFYLHGYEWQSSTSDIVYSTKKGRKITLSKVWAGVAGITLVYFVLCSYTFILFFNIYDYVGLWGANVSSQFNYVSEGIFIKPFLTWKSLNVGQYLIISVVLCYILIIVFSLISSVLGILIRNSYFAFLLFILLFAFLEILPSICVKGKWWTGYFLSNFSSVRIYMTQAVWFTEYGSISITPWHETIGTFMNLLLFAIATVISFNYFKKRDI